MFFVEKGSKLTVGKASRGYKKSTGAQYALLKFYERDNQREGMERPSLSNSAINVWFESHDDIEGIADGDVIRILDFNGVKWLHEQYFDSRTGEPRYRDTLELTGAKVEKA